MNAPRTLALLGMTALSLSLAGAAQAAFLPNGTYTLHNHPDGSARPPLYGARFDELKNLTGDTDIFTMDFDNASSLMTMIIGNTSIRIVGQSYGGVDVGNAYAPAADPVRGAYTGVYQIDFTYNVGVANVPGDDDKWDTAATGTNFGTITAPNGYKVNLTNMFMGDYSFRVGDETDDAGHRGYNGISGWGWMSYVNGDKITHVDSTDWLFTASYNLPAPGSCSLLAIGGLVTLRRRR